MPEIPLMPCDAEVKTATNSAGEKTLVAARRLVAPDDLAALVDLDDLVQPLDGN
jgi:hypothetical protein